LKKSAGIVHQSVETAELLKSHQSTGGDQRAKVGRDEEKVFQGFAGRKLFVQGLGMSYSIFDGHDLPVDLFLGGIWVNSRNYLDALLRTIVEEQLAWGFRAEEQE
jgi:hypothetical protein